MSNIPEDKLLDDYLHGDSEFSLRYKSIESDEVPIALDTFVIAKATQEVVNNSRPNKRWRTWSAPLAIAATIVLTVSILMQSNVHAPAVKLDMPKSSSGEQAKYVSENTRATDQAAKPSTKPVTNDSNQPTTPIQVAPSSPPLPSQNVVATKMQRREVTQDSSVAVDVIESPAPVVAVAPSESMPVARAAGAAIPEEKPTTNAASMQQFFNASKPNKTSELEETIVTGSLNKKQTSAERKLAKQIREADPEAWLEYIRELRIAGKNFAANKEWKHFQKVYPDYVVAANDSARRR